MTVLVLAAFALLVSSIALLVIGLRGRQVDDHPVCRRCKFDLCGAAPGSTNCPECGADVTRRRTVRIGNRGRRHRMLAVAVTLLPVAVAPLAFLGWAGVRGVDLTRFRLASSVIGDVKGQGPDAISRAALRELARRVAAGGLSDAQVNDLADRALKQQADRTQPWVHPWGEFLEAAHDAGRLDEARWSRYLTEAAGFDIVVRPAVRRGDAIPLTIQGGRVRVGRDGRFIVQHGAPAVYALPDVLLGRDPGGIAAPARLSSGNSAGTWAESLIRPDADVLAKLPDGPHVAQAVFNVTITDASSKGRPFQQDVNLSAPFTLLPDAQPSVTVTRDPTITARFQKAIRIENVWMAGGAAYVSYGVGDLPFGQPFSVRLRAGDREWQLGSALVSGGGTHLLAGGPVGGFDPTHVDVIFHPDVDTAMRTTFISSIWKGDVVIPDVEVLYPQGPQPPPQQQQQQTRPAPPQQP
jgi:hypothetical protein